MAGFAYWVRIRWHFIIAERTRATKVGALAIISRSEIIS